MARSTDTSELQKEINRKEKEYRQLRKESLRLKKSRGPLEIKNYTFLTDNGKPVTLLSMFKDRNEILIIHNMGKSCRYCTLWADGFNGYLPHLDDRIPVYLTTPDEPAIQKEFKKSRKWKFSMLSTSENTFKKDLGFEPVEGDYYPGISILKKRDDRIYETVHDFFGPGDNYSSIWHLFDLLEKGVNNWEPQYAYQDK